MVCPNRASMRQKAAIVSWWLRSPNPWNANNAAIVNTDGSLNNNNANNGNGCVPD